MGEYSTELLDSIIMQKDKDEIIIDAAARIAMLERRISILEKANQALSERYIMATMSVIPHVERKVAEKAA